MIWEYSFPTCLWDWMIAWFQDLFGKSLCGHLSAAKIKEEGNISFLLHRH